MDHARAGRWNLRARQPWYIGLDDDNEIAIGQQRVGIEAVMQGVIGRQTQKAGGMHDDGHGEAFGEAAELAGVFAAAPEARGNQQGTFRRQQPVGQLVDERRVRMGACWRRPRWLG
jgi:hypothetical protein